MADKPDYYEVLGVTKTATVDEIDKAYKKLAFQCHPDRMRGKPENEVKRAAEKFALANEAKGVLLDPAKRRTYDSYGHKGLENLASGKSGGTGQSYTEAAGPVRERKPLSEEGLFDYFDKRSAQRVREATKDGDEQHLSSAERRARAAEERIKNREARRGPFSPSAPETPASSQTPAAKSDFKETAAKLDEAASRLKEQGMAAVPLDVLQKFRENLQDFIDDIDEAIANAKSSPKNGGRRP